MTEDVSNEKKVGDNNRRDRDDVLCLGTPPELDLTTEEAMRQWRRYVTGVARAWTWRSYGPQNVPFDIEWGETQILVSGDPDEMDAFYVDHLLTCNRCAEGVALAKAYVTQGMSATLVRIFYTEVW